MLALHKQSPRTPQEQERLTREIESTAAQIDRLVYGLYGLTKEEIAIVEGRATEAVAIEESAADEIIEVTAEDELSDPMIKEPAEDTLADYSLYKCSECGKIVTGFMKEEHGKKAHKGRRVEWSKLGE
jgi:hypothetical protein